MKIVLDRAMADDLPPLEGLVEQSDRRPVIEDGVPLLLFGNVLPDPEAFSVLEDCGARIVDDDLCTGSRQLVPYRLERRGDGLGHHPR